MHITERANRFFGIQDSVYLKLRFRGKKEARFEIVNMNATCGIGNFAKARIGKYRLKEPRSSKSGGRIYKENQAVILKSRR